MFWIGEYGAVTFPGDSPHDLRRGATPRGNRSGIVNVHLHRLPWHDHAESLGTHYMFAGAVTCTGIGLNRNLDGDSGGISP